MELDLDLEADARMDLYFDLLTVYLLVDSALGKCELATRMSAALDSGDDTRMATELRHFEALPEELRTRVIEGDPTLATLLEVPGARAEHPPAKARSTSA
jgi:hypothetical protein